MRLVLPPVLALAACNAPTEPANESAPVEVNAAGGNAAEPVTTNDAVANAATNGAMPPFAEVPGAHPTAPKPAPIPAKFRGTWAETKALCADLKHHSRLGISGRTVRYPTFNIFSDTVTASADQFALKGKIEGTGRPAEAQFFINAAGNVLIDGGGGGAVRVRCG